MNGVDLAFQGEIAARQWMACMLRGDFRSAWRTSDFIRLRGLPDPHRFWDGKPLDGRRVMLRCLHGLGDAVHFLRYARKLSALAKSLTVEVAPPMVGLAPCFAGVSQVVTWGNAASQAPQEWDCQIEVMELPYVFRTEPCDLPVAENYLQLPPQMQIASKIGPAFLPRIGFVWAAGAWNPARSVPFSLLRRLFSSDDCECWNLQGGPEADAWSTLPHCERFYDARTYGDGLLALAATIQEMDLVITVDTLTAHLAGAMNKNTWLLLGDPADWRWMKHRSDTPWYPSLRLFRQPSPGDWAGLILRVNLSLTQLLRTAHRYRREADR